MNDAVTAFISGFIIIMFGAVFYVLWDNSCKKFQEFEEHIKELLDLQSRWMDEVEKLILESNDNIIEIRKNYEEKRLKLTTCIRKP